MRKRIATWIALCSFATVGLHATAAELSPAEIDQQAGAILAKIPVEKRIELLAGVRNFSTRGYSDAGLPEYLMSDGPIGVTANRREYASSGRDVPKAKDRSTTAFPSDILLAATWDPSLAHQEGVALAREARDYGIHIMLGPGVNIYRLPVCGRNFEYMGEDPFLASRMAVGYIEGVQSQGVSACVKHFACNNQEHQRHEYNAVVDERALHEIYLPAFEAAVKEAHVRSIMSSYNMLNGTYTASSRALLQDLLRGQWHFDGLCMSDWDSIHETLRTINDGVDLEMPEPKFLAPEKVRPLIASGAVSQATIDTKLRRIIRLGVEMGWNTRPQYQPMSPGNYDANDGVALKVARAGITLLKNDNGMLPLDRSKIKSLAVVGPGAAEYVSGDGSSRIQARNPRTILDGLKQVAGAGVQIIHVPTASTNVEQLAAASVFEKAASDLPLKAEYFNNSDLSGSPVATLHDSKIAYNWHAKLPIPQVTGEKFSIRWSGKIRAPIDGTYVFALQSDDGSRICLDGDQILDNWRSQRSHIERVRVELKANQTHELRVEYFNGAKDAQMFFGWGPAANAIADDQIAAIKSADAVICCVHTLDSEGDDRPYNLPMDQEELIQEAVAANPKTIVVLNSGGNVGMSGWIDHVPALLDAYFSGQAGGLATAEILFGDVNPSGHLPATFEKNWKQAFASFGYPGDRNKTVLYREGVFVGYRFYDSNRIEPRFPFGHGLSYTTFKISDVHAEASGDNRFNVTATVTNTGARAGGTIAQLYVRPSKDRNRPFQELKAFARVELQPGASQNVTLNLTPTAFATWSVEKHDWVVPAGEYDLAIGQSSRAIDATTKVVIH